MRKNQVVSYLIFNQTLCSLPILGLYVLQLVLYVKMALTLVICFCTCYLGYLEIPEIQQNLEDHITSPEVLVALTVEKEKKQLLICCQTTAKAMPPAKNLTSLRPHQSQYLTFSSTLFPIFLGDVILQGKEFCYVERNRPFTQNTCICREN